MYFLGLDIGSSSVKLALLDGDSGRCIAQSQQPEGEFLIEAPEQGWAEQSPQMWWQAVCAGMKELLVSQPQAKEKIQAIGISYQMHGLVVLDRNLKSLYPSIIWCDSRATEVGAKVFGELGNDWCMQNLLNSPGNFTFAKLKWLQEYRPEIFAAIDKIMLPGDYIAACLTGEATTTPSGLSEGILWNFKQARTANEIFAKYDLDMNLLPKLVPNFGEAGELSAAAAAELGLKPGIKLTYRAGDQPNNAFSLNVLEAGEFATTAGTSGVIYAVTDQLITDENQRINSFLHVNQQKQKQTIGLLACINGAGRMNSWLRNLFATAGSSVSYNQLSDVASTAPIGSLGLSVLPFGNGAERMLGNKLLQAQIAGLDLNRHGLPHIARAVQEGVAFAMAMGTGLINQMGVTASVIRAGKSNMYLSNVFSTAFVNATQTPVELYDTNGAEGAARGAAWGCGFYANREDAFRGLKKVQLIEPQAELKQEYSDAYSNWNAQLRKLLDA